MGLINIDFADLRTILQGQGRLAYLNTAEFPRKEKTTQEVTEKLLNSPLHPYGIRGAKGVLFNVVSEKGLTLSEVSQISKAISDLANPEAKIIFGISQNQKRPNIIKITLLANGCGTKLFSSKLTKRRKRSPRKKKILPKIVKKRRRKRKKPVAQKPKKPQKRKKRRKKSKPRASKKTKVKVRVNKEKKEIFATTPSKEKTENKVRKNGLQLKKEAEEARRDVG